MRNYVREKQETGFQFYEKYDSTEYYYGYYIYGLSEKCLFQNETTGHLFGRP
jgi:hypothetical protein